MYLNPNCALSTKKIVHFWPCVRAPSRGQILNYVTEYFIPIVLS